MKAQTPTPEREPVPSGKQIPFYWKTTCHTCRAAKKSLEAQAVPIEPIDIMKHPPSERTLRQLIGKYGARGMIRRNAKEYRTLHVGKMEMSDGALAKFLRNHPDVACRPIVIVRGQAFLSKDPEFARSPSA